MVQVLNATAASVVTRSPVAPAALSIANNASIAAYLAAGERMRVLAGWVAIAGLAFILLFTIAMVVGVIPVRMF